MTPELCLLPSPLLGPACWQPVAALLPAHGWRVCELPASPAAPRTGADALDAFLSIVPDDRDSILVAHSNAGLFVPLIAAARKRVTGYVFADAGLPAPGPGQVPMIPSRFYDMLAGLADDTGTLPAWTRWWDDEDLSGLFPSAQVRALVEGEQRQLPLSYFAETLPVPEAWPARRGAYLAFGDGYAAEHAVATALGWATRVIDGEHLHMLVDPPALAAAIARLAAGISRHDAQAP
ncbi:MAG TPA: alpha/beta hydrolase [Trebonia sp.]